MILFKNEKKFNVIVKK